MTLALAEKYPVLFSQKLYCACGRVQQQLFVDGNDSSGDGSDFPIHETEIFIGHAIPCVPTGPSGKSYRLGELTGPSLISSSPSYKPRAVGGAMPSPGNRRSHGVRSRNSLVN